MADLAGTCTIAEIFCDIPSLLPAIVSAIGFLLSSGIAVIAIIRNQSIARRRATVDMVMHQKTDATLLNFFDTFNVLKGNMRNKPLSGFAGDDFKGAEESKAILAVLNNYEFIASGIFRNAFDYDLYQTMQHGIVVDRWDCLESFVKEARKSRSHPTLFQEFEKLASAFKRKPLQLNKSVR
jgi:hypothetical protein